MEEDKQNIDVFVSELSKKHNRKYCSEVFNKFYADMSFIIKNYREGEVSEKTMLALIERSKKVSCIKWFIPDIFALISANSITDNVLNVCLHYPGRFRNTLLTQLGHMDLTISQLEVLNARSEIPEVFYKLLCSYLHDENYSLDEFKLFLKTNTCFYNEIIHVRDCHVITNGDIMQNEKLIMIDEFCKR